MCKKDNLQKCLILDWKIFEKAGNVFKMSNLLDFWWCMFVEQYDSYCERARLYTDIHAKPSKSSSSSENR